MYSASALLALFGMPPMSPILLVLDLPTLVQELVLGIWLIVKGFTTTPQPLATAGAAVEAAPAPALVP